MAGPDWLYGAFAHRGLHDATAGIVENTISAVETAVSAGYGVEIDVRPCFGGEPVVFHDATLERLTGATGRLDHHSIEQLAAIAYRSSSDKICTLAELLETVAGRTPVLVEIKSDWTADAFCAMRVAQRLEAYRGPVAAMSFDPAVVTAVARTAPSVVRGIVVQRVKRAAGSARVEMSGRSGYLIELMRARPQFIAYDVRALPSPTVAFARKILHLPVLTWTIRTEDQRRLAERYADGIIFECIRP